jgi:LacI family transcriptional regulator
MAATSTADALASFHGGLRAIRVVVWPAVPISRMDLQTGRVAARQLLERGQLPDAILCANDLVALGVLSELREVGVRCPEDVLVTGFDDLVPTAELLGLTTVRQPLSDIGREAARLLQFASGAPRTVRLAPTLIVRSTTSRVRS